MANYQFIRFNAHRRRAAILLKCCIWLQEWSKSDKNISLINKGIARCLRYISGAEGEERLLGLPDHQPGCLAELPDNYIVFNQVLIRADRAVRELDYIVLGPSGIFLIEVKNNQGVITGSDHSETWHQYTDFNKQKGLRIRNPVKQVISALKVFNKILSSHDITAQIQPLVVYSNPSCTLANEESTTPVLRLSELANFILTYRNGPSRDQIHNVYSILSRSQKTFNRFTAQPALFDKRHDQMTPMHISYFMQDLVQNRVRDIMNHKLELRKQAPRTHGKALPFEENLKPGKKVKKTPLRRQENPVNAWDELSNRIFSCSLIYPQSWIHNDDLIELSQTSFNHWYSYDEAGISRIDNYEPRINSASGFPMIDSGCCNIDWNPCGSDQYDSFETFVDYSSSLIDD